MPGLPASPFETIFVHGALGGSTQPPIPNVAASSHIEPWYDTTSPGAYVPLQSNSPRQRNPSPLSPFKPLSPLRPCSPWTPCSPLRPCSPFGPCAPGSPLGPLSPTAPWAPA